MRIGHGYDVHAFGEGDTVILGGVNIPYEKGLVAHSDGDVLLHALCDAMLGAAGLGDIGKCFPDTDIAYKGIDSRILLRRVVGLLDEKGYVVGNTDITVMAQAPKISKYTSTMVENIADDLKIPKDHVNIKATTTEKLGFVGRKEGIAAEAVVLIKEKPLG
jgi:2-C-methyl-D-erythritol 2,4-cyclodiphosphate synthase